LAIQDAIDVRVFGSALGARFGPASDPQEGIVVGISRWCWAQGFEAGDGLAAVGEYESLAAGDAAQHALGILAEREHGHGLH